MSLLNGRRGEPVNSKAYLEYELNRLKERNSFLEREFYQSGDTRLREEILLNEASIKRLEGRLNPNPLVSRLEKLRKSLKTKKK